MKEERLNRLSNWVYKIARIGEALTLVVSLVLPMLAVYLIANRERLEQLAQEGWTFSVNGMSEQVLIRNGELRIFAVVMFVLTVVAVGIATAAMLDRLCTVVKRVGNGTPFRRDVIEPMRQIGHLCIAIPIAESVGMSIATLGTGTDTVMDISGIFIGLVVLWVTRAFIRGVELEDDMEGLL